MSEKDILTKKSLDIEDNLAKTEENFIASYGKHEQKPLQILLSLYKGHYYNANPFPVYFLRLSSLCMVSSCRNGRCHQHSIRL